MLANEAPRIIGCNRVSVLVKRGRKLRLEAVSGQESIERRASAVQAIQELVRVVAKAGDPLWHPEAGRELPPQIEEELEAEMNGPSSFQPTKPPGSALRNPPATGERPGF